MKRVLLACATVFLAGITVVAQNQPATSSTSQGSGSSMPKHTSDTKSAKAGKTLTGCLSQSANTEGNYTLTNRRKKTVELISTSEDLSKHAGHEVQLSGNWTTEKAEGKTTEKSEANEDKNEKHFQVSSVKDVADTCETQAASGMATHSGHHGKHKKSAQTTTTSANTTPAPNPR
ncbi:MAG TPA: hypothetical protein VN577_05370 [Terriglobales bacterium]|nr:hypothetical protein [Terriglobales bacterium]